MEQAHENVFATLRHYVCTYEKKKDVGGTEADLYYSFRVGGALWSFGAG
jgi:hypothetical protein